MSHKLILFIILILSFNNILCAQNNFANNVSKQELREFFLDQEVAGDRYYLNDDSNKNDFIINQELDYMLQINKHELMKMQIDNKERRIVKMEEAMTISILAFNIAQKTHNSHLYVNMMDISEAYLRIYTDLNNKNYKINTPVIKIISQVLQITEPQVTTLLNTGLING